MRLSLFAVAALCVSSLAAHASTITFSGLAAGNPSFTTYTEAGYTVTVLTGSFKGTTSFGAPPPSIYLAMGSGTIAVTNGGLFDFSSVSLGNAALSDSANFIITGLLNGVTVFQNTQSVGPTLIYTYTFAADSAFNIDTLRIAGTRYGTIDNINVNAFTPVAATPEPSSLALLGTGVLGVFGAMKRRLA